MAAASYFITATMDQLFLRYTKLMTERSVVRKHAASQKTLNVWDAVYIMVKDRVLHNVMANDYPGHLFVYVGKL